MFRRRLRGSRLGFPAGWLALLLVASAWPASAAGGRGDTRANTAAFPAFRSDRLLVRPRPGAESRRRLSELHRRLRASVVYAWPAVGGWQVLELPAGSDIPSLVNAYRLSGEVARAEPDYWVHATGVPDDPDFASGLQWHLRNTGQDGGVAGADIHAVPAWDIIHAAPELVVAVIDSGIRLTHEDLAANLWVNPAEVPENGVDDDGNGFVDDVHGINAVDRTGDARDVAGHGTHVAGIVGAVGDNGLGVAGVAWKVRLMACRFLASNGSGSISDAITCIEYARQMGARIMTASWVGTEYSAALEEAVAAARDAGILFIAAAGNDGKDNDATAYYPPNLPLDNVISVAATTRTDGLLNFSNFGALEVDLAAPGLSIYSTYFVVNNSYLSMAGTSPAAPQVAGAAALVMAAFPEADYREVRDRILLATDTVPALEGRCRTEGRLNLERALVNDSRLVGPRVALPARAIAGKPFSRTRWQFTLANWDSVPAAWSVQSSTNWLTISPAAGSLAVGERVEVTAALNDRGYALPIGIHTNTIEFFWGMAGADATSVPVRVEVYPPTWLTYERLELPLSGVRLGLQGEPLATYVIEGSAQLATWSPRSTNTLPAGGLLPDALVITNTGANRFFRALRVGP